MAIALVPPDIPVVARKWMMTELSARGTDVPWYIEAVPESRPSDDRFVVVEQIETRRDTMFAVDALVQFKVYDPNLRRGRELAELINGLCPMLPGGLEIQWTEHAGGPTELPDPDVPGVRRWLVTWWLTARTAAV